MRFVTCLTPDWATSPLNPVTTSITPPSPKRPRPILWLVSKPRRSPRRSDLIVEAPVVSLCDAPGLRDS